ncbi:unnamed protein product [Allacma fusca]|uniref:Peptidase S1 domain-containing protein n=1 Tax=Allacma fusca TaxID=39272 RepID=A0A8J2L9E3_9HEXA|nr:unnamed protein product [Allacma fusca]
MVSAVPNNGTKKLDARLGLLAQQLGVEPVPGASYGGGGGETAYSGGGGGSYGGGGGPPPPAPVKQCKCIPKANCVNPNAGGSVYPQPPVGGGGGGSGYPQPPVGGGGGGPDYGGNPPPPPPVGGPGPDYGNQGGGGLVNPGYPGDLGGQHGGNGGGIDPGVQPGYGQDGQGNDGAGLIDIRIVNKPPGGVVCLSGEVYCCQGGNTGGPSYPSVPEGPYPAPQPGPGPYPVGPQGGCGVRQFIDVPGFNLDYGQAKFGAYPWMAVMLGPQNNYIGAGALIDNYHVLTAAHKVADYSKGGFKIRFGEWNAQEDSEPYKNVEIEVARVDIHPAFNPQNLQNDVSVLTLAQPISLDKFPHIKSACLPQQGGNYVGKRCWVAGFGKDAFQVGKHSYILREVDVPVVESNECEQRLRGTRLGGYFTLNRKSFLCAGGEEGKDACTGDGGSPLVCEINGRFSVVGLVAWGIGCADYGIPGVYVNVGNYVNWIQSQLQGSDLQGYARIKPAPPKKTK